MTLSKKVLAIGGSLLFLFTEIKAHTNATKKTEQKELIISSKELDEIHRKAEKTGIYVCPEGVVKVGYRFFFKCNWLKKVVFPTTLKHIGRMAFYGTSIQEVNIPEGVTKIGVASFGLCGKLRKVTLPSTLTRICNGTFWNTDLQDLTLPEGLAEIGGGAFEGTPLQNLILPEKIVSIGHNAFAGTNIKEITLPGNISNIAGVYFEKKFNGGKPYEYDEANGADPIKNFIAYMLFGKKDITELTLPDGATSITNSDFHGKLNKIILPASLVTFGYSSVEKNALKEVVFAIENSKLKRIKGYAFWNTNVKEVIIPPTVTDLGGLQFDGPFNNGKPYKYTQKNKDSLKPLIDIMLFGKTNGIKEFKIPENVTEIAEGTFWMVKYSNLKKVILPAALKNVGGFVFENTFNNNKSYVYIKSIKKKDNFRRFIDFALFSNTYNIHKITVPEGVVKIENFALKDKTLTEVTFPSTLRKIGGFHFENTFDKNKPYKYVSTNNDDLKNLMDLILFQRRRIRQISIPEGVVEIEKGALRPYRKLETITFPSTLRKIGGNQFHHSRIKKVIVPRNVAVLVLPVIPKGVEVEYKDETSPTDSSNPI